MRISRKDRQKRLAVLSNCVQQLSAARDMFLIHLADHEATLGLAQAEYHGLLNEGAAISLLPDDILAMIFEQAHKSQLDCCHVEIPISHVCRRWRDMALCLPMLWARIRREQEQVHLGRIDAYLRRSQYSPISLEIYMAYYEDSQDLLTFYRLITPHLPRCRYLRVACASTFHSCWVQFLDILKAIRLPLLSHVWMYHLGGEVALKTIAETSPSLTAVHLTDTDIRACPFSFEFVTHLRLDGEKLPPAIDIREGLSHIPCLAHLELVHLYGIAADGWDVQLLRLRVFSIEVLNEAFAGSYVLLVLRGLRIPLLETLSLKGYAEPSDVHGIDASGDLSQLFPSLRHLIIRNSPVPMRHLAVIFPSIIELTYVGDRLDNLYSLKTILCPLHNAPLGGIPTVAFWPRLATVTLPNTSAVALEGIRDTLVHRSEAGYPLGKLILQHAPVDCDMRGCVKVERCVHWNDPTRYFE